MLGAPPWLTAMVDTSWGMAIHYLNGLGDAALARTGAALLLERMPTGRKKRDVEWRKAILSFAAEHGVRPSLVPPRKTTSRRARSLTL